MKSLYKYALILVAVAVVPFARTNAQDLSASALPFGAPTTTESQDELINVADLRNQPLPIRRQIVAAELQDILLRLNVVYDKTKTTLDRLAQNGVDTTAAESELVNTATALAQGKITIDALTLAASEKSEALILIVNGAPFKDGVVKSEVDLRAARDHLIQSLLLLKVAATTASLSSASLQ